MNCSKCGCELTEGYSKFCPECGTPVEPVEETPVKEPVVINKTSEGSKLSLAFRIVLGILVAISAIWIFFPLLRSPGKEITTISAFKLIIGTDNFDGFKIGAMPYLAVLFLIPQIFCLIFVFIRNLDIHRRYSVIGTFLLYHSIVSVCIWILTVNICNSYLHGEYAYGLGFVINIIASMLTAFLCISLSASQKTETKRSECWLSVIGIFNTVILGVLGIVNIAGFIFTSLFRDVWPCTILTILSVASGIWAYISIVKKDFSQWLVMLIHAVITFAAHISLFLYAKIVVNDFVGNNDFLGIAEVGAPYINAVVISVLIFSVLYNTAITIWTYKLLKRPLKHR